jgi:hypothetical protein
VQKDNLYRCLDNLLAHKTHLFSFLQQRWTTLFEAKFEVMLYDLTRGVSSNRGGASRATACGGKTQGSVVTLSGWIERDARTGFTIRIVGLLDQAVPDHSDAIRQDRPELPRGFPPGRRSLLAQLTTRPSSLSDSGFRLVRGVEVPVAEPSI